jgi:hypothetical protein
VQRYLPAGHQLSDVSYGLIGLESTCLPDLAQKGGFAGSVKAFYNKFVVSPGINNGYDPRSGCVSIMLPHIETDRFNRMRFYSLACFAWLFGASVLAQTNNDASNLDRRDSRPENQVGNIPPGGCTPIGLTARGDLVFPIQCRELIERERGPVPDQTLDQKSATGLDIKTPNTRQNQIMVPEAKNKSSRIARAKKQHRTLEINPETTGSIEDRAR